MQRSIFDLIDQQSLKKKKSDLELHMKNNWLHLIPRIIVEHAANKDLFLRSTKHACSCRTTFWRCGPVDYLYFLTFLPLYIFGCHLCLTSLCHCHSVSVWLDSVKNLFLLLTFNMHILALVSPSYFDIYMQIKCILFRNLSTSIVILLDHLKFWI